MMKKLIAGILAVVLLTALAVPALAMSHKRMYATKEGVKVYIAPDRHSEVVTRLYKGEEINAVDKSDDGKWYGFYPPDDSMGLCWVQKKFLSSDVPCEHEWTKWKVVREATCTHTGLRTRHCKLCGLEQKETIKKKDHEYGEWHVEREATDHSPGLRTRTCVVCGHEETKEFDPEGTLRRGDRGEDVRRVQQQLADQGYLNVGGVDGTFGGGMEKAVMRFQADQGLNADGVAWPQTQKRLQHDFGPWETVKAPTRTEPGQRQRVCKDCGYVQTETVEAGDVIERGSRGESVRALQQILKQVGFDAGSFDGIYGQKLDSAFADFDAAHSLTFQPGRVRPADVDALVSAWLEASAEPPKEGDVDSPVDMALNVTPASDEFSDRDVTTYHWSLTNLGNEKCMFSALLLTYGKDADFSKDDLVMVIDGEELKADAGNSVSGSFKVADAWGEGSLNFAALAVDEKTGEKWLSNVVVFDAAASGEAKTVAPLPVDLNLSALPDGAYSVGFDPGDIAEVKSGVFMNAVHIYTMDTYAAEALEGLAEGDTVIVDGAPVVVKTVEIGDGSVDVNGGLDGEDGVEFAAIDGENTYRVWSFDDMATYTDRGATTLTVDPAAKFIDNSDIDDGAVTADYDGLVKAIQSSEDDDFDPYNTTVTLENGRVMVIDREYTP